ncbi:hypothetical protein D3C74_290670 [compost metagenome]
MVRMPWVKGLLVSFPFDDFIKEKRASAKIKDIYGKEYDILEDKIEIIFTKSQFKMWKYYSSWDEYKEFFKKFECMIGICNEEEDVFQDKKLNYQMLQTLTDITDEEINYLTSKTNQKISMMSNDRKTMLDVFGVSKNRKNMNHFQQSLLLYPEMLEDEYTKHSLKQIKKKVVKEARSGKIDINCKYAFACPDLYAFCEYLFLDNKNPQGLLKNGEVSFSEYETEKDLDCLRSPHLYREHAVRINIHNNETKKWYITKGIYTSIHDPISKILMFDNDGDTLLIVRDEVFVNVAKRNMKGIIPLFYNMRKADNHQISPDMIYQGLTSAYTGGNIGIISNDISKVWNSDEINLDIIKWKCMLNNFTIDYAKTLYKPKIPILHKNIISSYTKLKAPHFFMYAKDKGEHQVESKNNSTMNRISEAVLDRRMNFSKINVEPFDYKMLMRNKEATFNPEIIELYQKHDRENARRGVNSISKRNTKDGVSEYIKIRIDIEEYFKERGIDIFQVVDSLIDYLFNHKNSKFKKTFWSSFGDIVLINLKKNIEEKSLQDTIVCENCGTRVTKKSNRTKYCDPCWKEHRNEYQKELMREKRKK